MNAFRKVFGTGVAFLAALLLGVVTAVPTPVVAQEVKAKPAVVQAKPLAAPVRENGKSVDIEPKKRKSIVTTKFPYTLEYWTGNKEVGWKKVTIDEPGTYGFQFSKGRFAVTKAEPLAAEDVAADPAAKTKISLANSGTYPITLHFPAKKAPGLKEQLDKKPVAAKPVAAKPVKIEDRLAGPQGFVVLFPNGPGMALAARQEAAAANDAANARLIAELLALDHEARLKDAMLAGVMMQNELKAAQVAAAFLPPGPERDAADAKVAKLQADLAGQANAFRANRAVLDKAKVDAAAAQQAHLAAAARAVGLLPNPAAVNPVPAVANPALARLLGGADNARQAHEAAKVGAAQAELQAKDAKIAEVRALGELFMAKTDDDAADKKLAAAVQDQMRKKGTAGEAAAKALVAKLQQEKAESKKKLDAATTKVADAVKKSADQRKAADVAKAAEDKARNVVRAACAKLVEFALRNAL